MISKEAVQSLVEEKLSDAMFIVEITVGSGNAISVVLDSDSGINIEQCIEVSRHVEHSFDREVEDFSLEVSSPGLTQPFKVLRQYLKYQGKEVEIVTSKGDKQTGILESANESGFVATVKQTVKIEGKKTVEVKPIEFSYNEIKSVKPVITFK